MLFQLADRGGLLMAPILLCSVIGLALFLQRLWALQTLRVMPPRLMEVVLSLVTEGRCAEAENVCAGSNAAVAQVALAALRRRGRAQTRIREAVIETGRREVALLNRFVGGLGTIASISPLIGLLGTVAGMISVFQRVVDEVGVRGQVNPGALAGGIWEALITTAAGLSVAIPAYIGYRYLEGRIDRTAIELEGYALNLVEALEEVTAEDPNP